jgi:Holliday junction resolvase RusA-like endonuclease
VENSIKLVYEGRPLVQKNNLNIYYIGKGAKKRPIIGHTKKMSAVRMDIALKLHEQYMKQRAKPIDYLFEIYFTFYVEKRSEPDLDNLPAIFLDAMQGYKDKKLGLIAVTLLNDKLNRRESSHKIVKGDKLYHGEPRTEIEIRRYLPEN